MSFKSARSLVIGAFCLSLASCTRAVPHEKADYIGSWNGKGFHLVISQGGKVEYRRKAGRSSTSIKGPLQRFEGDDFFVGIWFLSTKFAVSVPPHERNGSWTMVVDGVELRKAP